MLRSYSCIDVLHRIWDMFVNATFTDPMITEAWMAEHGKSEFSWVDIPQTVVQTLLITFTFNTIQLKPHHDHGIIKVQSI